MQTVNSFQNMKWTWAAREREREREWERVRERVCVCVCVCARACVRVTAQISTTSSIGTTTLTWVSACSTVVKHSQQEGFTGCHCQWHVKHPTWRRTRDLERSNLRHTRPPTSEATLANPAAEDGTGARNGREILPKVATSTSLLGDFNYYFNKIPASRRTHHFFKHQSLQRSNDWKH
jgi:hypothetical protein